MKPLTILVVDDEAAIRDFFSKLIPFLGHEVILAANGFEAVECVQKTPQLDLVFMDFKMPGMDGLETFRQIRKLNSQLPVIIVTGYAPEETLAKARQAGVNGCLRKPMELREIKDIILATQKKDEIVSVLVVDDDSKVLDFFKKLSAAVSCQVEAALNSDEAIEKLSRQHFNLVFLDVVFPPGEFEQIRNAIQKLNPPLPEIVLISAYPEELRKAKERMKSSLAGCLYKPFDLNDVIETIQAVAKKNG